LPLSNAFKDVQGVALSLLFVGNEGAILVSSAPNDAGLNKKTIKK